MTANINGFDVPVYLTASQAQALFPRGVIGLTRVDAEPPHPVLPMDNGSLVLDHGGRYALPTAPRASDPAHIGASGDVVGEILRPGWRSTVTAAPAITPSTGLLPQPMQPHLPFGWEQDAAFARQGGWAGDATQLLGRYDENREADDDGPWTAFASPPQHQRQRLSPTSAQRRRATSPRQTPRGAVFDSLPWGSGSPQRTLPGTFRGAATRTRSPPRSFDGSSPRRVGNTVPKVGRDRQPLSPPTGGHRANASVVRLSPNPDDRRAQWQAVLDNFDSSVTVAADAINAERRAAAEGRHTSPTRHAARPRRFVGGGADEMATPWEQQHHQRGRSPEYQEDRPGWNADTRVERRDPAPIFESVRNASAPPNGDGYAGGQNSRSPLLTFSDRRSGRPVATTTPRARRPDPYVTYEPPH